MSAIIGTRGWTSKLDKLDGLLEGMLSRSRIPGAAVAVVAGGELVFAKGYGYRDNETKLPMTAQTSYPIASTSKGLNAALIGMLSDEGRLAWDTPVRNYLPSFGLQDPSVTACVTLRDLVTMRTGLPRHDWMWVANPIGREELVARMRHLDASAPFRERFQYNNLSATAAGHIAEVVAGKTWEELVSERIFQPLGMTSSGFSPQDKNATLSYHENSLRRLICSRRLASAATAPSGGAIHSTVVDMARWMIFNLAGGRVAGRALIELHTLQEIHSTQVLIPPDPAARKPTANYALGWTVDTYNGSERVAHGGYLHDVDSEVTLFPREQIGIVSFINFGPSMPSLLINEHVFDMLMGLKSLNTVEQKLMAYEKAVDDMKYRAAAVCRVDGTIPSCSLDDYVGDYHNPGYGLVQIASVDDALVLRRGELELWLDHWHYDVWIARSNDLFVIHLPHAFDRTSQISFRVGGRRRVNALTIPLEPALPPIHFEKSA